MKSDDFSDERILRGDTSLFTILTAMSPNDRETFLELQNVIGGLYPGYCYLEVGSDLGGSLIAPLLDSRCGHLASVDLRPDSQPDERGRHFDFPDNSTARMVQLLTDQGVSEQALSRLRTFDADLAEIPFWRIGMRARLAFIDAEHTNQAAFRDWLNVSRFMEQDGIVAFHDANLIFDGLENVQAMLRHQGVHFSAYYLPDTMFIVATGQAAEEASRALRHRSLDAAAFRASARRALNQEIAHSVSLL